MKYHVFMDWNNNFQYQTVFIEDNIFLTGGSAQDLGILVIMPKLL